MMNAHTAYAMIAVLAAMGALTISPVFGQMEACPGCLSDDVREKAEAIALGSIPISVWTDREVYDHSSIIMVEGKVSNFKPGTPVTLTVTSPTNNVVEIQQLNVDSDRGFETTINTSGSLMKYDGTYIIKVQYGSQGIDNKARVQLSGGLSLGTPTSPVSCQPSEFSVQGACVPFSITGGSVTGTSIDGNSKSMIVRLNAMEDGTITLNPSSNVISGVFMVLVDGEEWDDVEYNGNEITVMFPAGTEKIEIVGTSVIPEFGGIAALILAVSIISIIVVSAKTRLSIIPKY